jgi:hypothetical protein
MVDDGTASGRRRRLPHAGVDSAVQVRCIGGTLSDGDIEFSLAVEAETLEEATASVFGTIRTAIHPAGGGTPGWPEYRDEGVTAQLVGA